MRKQVDVAVECFSCEGTGLYKGFAEKDGAAVICDHCKGTGRQTITYTPFQGRRDRDDVTRVYLPSGRIITDQDVTTVEGVTVNFSQYGVSYEDWKSGKEPIPIEYPDVLQ